MQSSSSGGSDQLFPVGHTPYLPTSHDILRGIKEIGATSVPLSEEHVESLLEVLRMDGDIERIQVMREPGDYDSEAEEADEGHTSKGKKRKADDGGGRNKKRVKMENGEDNQEEGDNSDDIDGFIVPDDEQEGDDLPPPIEIHGNGQTSARRKRPGPPGRSKFYYVYRSMPLASNNLNLYIGLIDAPCGVCPVAASCDNRGRPSMDDEPLSQVGVVNVVAGSASKLSKAQKEKQLVAFKPPGSMGAVDMAGPWTGGASRGVQRPGAINPSTCRYFREWLEG